MFLLEVENSVQENSDFSLPFHVCGNQEPCSNDACMINLHINLFGSLNGHNVLLQDMKFLTGIWCQCCWCTILSYQYHFQSSTTHLSLYSTLVPAASIIFPKVFSMCLSLSTFSLLLNGTQSVPLCLLADSQLAADYAFANVEICKIKNST